MTASTHSALYLPGCLARIRVADGLGEVPIDQEATVLNNQNISNADIPMQDLSLFVGVFMRYSSTLN
jgi:hypothetical protein